MTKSRTRPCLLMSINFICSNYISFFMWNALLINISILCLLQCVMAIPWNITEFANWTKAASSSLVERHSGKLIIISFSLFHLLMQFWIDSVDRTLQELVEHYSKDSDGLCVNLRLACVQVSTWSFIYISFGF